MAFNNHVSIVGNLTAKPKLRTSESGSSYCFLTIATTEKYKDTETTTFCDAVAYDQLAENICESLDKGHQVVALADFKPRKVTLLTKDDEEVDSSKIEFRILAIGASLRFATCEVTRAASPARHDDDDDDQDRSVRKRRRRDEDEDEGHSRTERRGRRNSAPADEDDDF